MITSVDFLPRAIFEKKAPAPGVAAISIGDHDQAAPLVLGGYEHALRLQFLDVDPEECWKYGIKLLDCFTRPQAEQTAKFLRDIHSRPGGISVLVHCEAGVSRSAAIALAAATFAGCDLPTRNASGANRHVARLMGEELGVMIDIPAADNDPLSIPSRIFLFDL